MKPADLHILTINGGSSSIKFALYRVEEPLQRRLYGKVDRIGLSGTNLTVHDPDGKPQASLSITVPDHKSAANYLIDWLEKQNNFEPGLFIRRKFGYNRASPPLKKGGEGGFEHRKNIKIPLSPPFTKGEVR